jgi:hypothetical protein
VLAGVHANSDEGCRIGSADIGNERGTTRIVTPKWIVVVSLMATAKSLLHHEPRDTLARQGREAAPAPESDAARRRVHEPELPP